MAIVAVRVQVPLRVLGIFRIPLKPSVFTGGLLFYLPFNPFFPQVFPCKCNPEDCDYKRQWVEAGSPTLVPYDVAVGKKHVPVVSEWLKAKYCNRKGILI